MSGTLEGVKVGDKLICRHSYGDRYDLYTVTRLTKTLAVCGESASFAIKDGKKRGSSSWNSRWAKMPNADDLARIQFDNRIRAVQARIAAVKVTADNLEDAEAFLAASNRTEGADK